MQRTTNVTVALLFVAALAAALVLGLRPKRTPEPVPAARPSASAQTSKSAATAPSAAPSAAMKEEDTSAALDAAVTDGFENFPDGGKVPELPASAPNRIGFGAVIFAYRGAQNAPSDARSKEAAKKKA